MHNFCSYNPDFIVQLFLKLLSISEFKSEILFKSILKKYIEIPKKKCQLICIFVPMFRLKLVTDPRWVNIVEENIHEILTDHAWCEQKAASNAISLIVSYPSHSELVQALSDIAQEELLHFQQVHAILLKKGMVLGPERKDAYVNELYKFIPKGKDKQNFLIERLLFSAMIEARSCERFRVLSENIKDPELATFYKELMISEANHYTVFLNFARSFDTKGIVDARWEEWLNYEAGIIENYGKSGRIHG